MKNLIKSVLFLGLCVVVFLYAVNPIFSVQHENAELRTATDIFLSFPEQTVDVLFVSASTYETFWQSPKAFHDTGIAAYGLTASYNYISGYQYEVMQALKTQSPKLIVFDLVRLSGQMDLVDAFNISASLHDRTAFLDFISYASEKLSQSGIPYNRLELYCPFIRFHHNWKNIKGTLSNAFIPHMESMFMGYYCNLYTWTDPNGWSYLDNMKAGLEPPAWERLSSVEQTPLDDWQVQILSELVDYCDTLDCEILFVRCPQVTYFEEWNGQWQSVLDYLEERGYSALDAIPYYYEIGLNWVEDYYNGNHTNYYGAIKFTNWLEQYLKEHYDLPDHRGEKDYEAWENEYQRLTEYVRTNADSNK